MPRPLILCCALLAWITGCLFGSLPPAAWAPGEPGEPATHAVEASVELLDPHGSSALPHERLGGSGDEPSGVEDLLEEPSGLAGTEPRAAGSFVDRAELDGGASPPARVWLDSASPPPRAGHA